MRAPPSSNGAFIVMIAVPKVSAMTEISSGAEGGPRGRWKID